MNTPIPEVDIFDRNYRGDIFIVSQHLGEDGFQDQGYYATRELAELKAERLKMGLRPLNESQPWLARIEIHQVADVEAFVNDAADEEDWYQSHFSNQ